MSEYAERVRQRRLAHARNTVAWPATSEVATMSDRIYGQGQMIDAQGRRIRARILKTNRGTQHVEYRVGTERYHSLEELEAEVM